MAVFQQPARTGRHLSRLFCGALTLLLLNGCSYFRDTSPFTEANDLFSKGNYSASLEKYEQIGEKLPAARDRVLFEKGVILAYPKNGQKDYQQALDCFQQLVRDYPESPYRQNSEALIFTISNVVLKDATIATQQAQIDTLHRELAGREGEIAALQENIKALKQKVFAVATRSGAVDRILIEKNERRLTLLAKGEAVKTYRIALGGNPVGPKERQGDNKTPEGIYTIDARNKDSGYHLSLHISYPNEKDRKRARELGVSPGGDVMIHGIKNGFSWVGNAHAEVDWTKGCIAVSNEEIEEIARVASSGTIVEIRP
ncbi:L,D-transpeptidase family protein [Geobacter sp. SVR]|uniref:L,D-transpeptidase family protein n=1 Tax=Geobacter sp. SVR TaxID=2495594 RepID=UPI00143F027C|nr:L,D-transpeptidase family protein [Geobacter sp. SVR]BCS55429.1 transpeptidase [Geobacter sp. SVR]GCF83431.1 transpeptidase [Geobacter sp. SVR]